MKEKLQWSVVFYAQFRVMDSKSSCVPEKQNPLLRQQDNQGAWASVCTLGSSWGYLTGIEIIFFLELLYNRRTTKYWIV